MVKVFTQFNHIGKGRKGLNEVYELFANVIELLPGKVKFVYTVARFH